MTYEDFDFIFDEPKETEIDIKMNKIGYGFYSNFDVNSVSLQELIVHLENHKIEYRIERAYHGEGYLLPENTIAFYIKNWNKNKKSKLVKKVNEFLD